MTVDTANSIQIKEVEFKGACDVWVKNTQGKDVQLLKLSYKAGAYSECCYSGQQVSAS